MLLIRSICLPADPIIGSSPSLLSPTLSPTPPPSPGDANPILPLPPPPLLLPTTPLLETGDGCKNDPTIGSSCRLSSKISTVIPLPPFTSSSYTPFEVEYPAARLIKLSSAAATAATSRSYAARARCCCWRWRCSSSITSW